MATRPQTLPAGIMPVVAATALAHHERHARLDMALCAALGALFLILPRNMFGSSYADERLLPVFFMVFFLSFAPNVIRPVAADMCIWISSSSILYWCRMFWL